MPSCPCCDSPGMVEAIAHGWFFCKCCSARFLVDGAGRVVRVLR